MATISKEVNIDILEKLPDGTFKKKNPSTTIENISKLREELDSLEHESGSNDDGGYIRFGNGWQVCWADYDLRGHNLSNPKNVNFPKPFIATPTVLHDIYRNAFDTPGIMTSRINPPTTNSIRHAHQLTDEAAVSGGYLAVGQY